MFGKKNRVYSGGKCFGTAAAVGPVKVIFPFAWSKIAALSEFIKDKHNVQVIKYMVRVIRILSKKSQENDKKSKERPEVTPLSVKQSKQLIPSHVLVDGQKRKERKANIQETSRFPKK